MSAWTNQHPAPRSTILVASAGPLSSIPRGCAGTYAFRFPSASHKIRPSAKRCTNRGNGKGGHAKQTSATASSSLV